MGQPLTRLVPSPLVLVGRVRLKGFAPVTNCHGARAECIGLDKIIAFIQKGHIAGEAGIIHLTVGIVIIGSLVQEIVRFKATEEISISGMIGIEGEISPVNDAVIGGNIFIGANEEFAAIQAIESARFRGRCGKISRDGVVGFEGEISIRCKAGEIGAECELGRIDDPIRGGSIVNVFEEEL